MPDKVDNLDFKKFHYSFDQVVHFFLLLFSGDSKVHPMENCNFENKQTQVYTGIRSKRWLPKLQKPGTFQLHKAHFTVRFQKF